MTSRGEPAAAPLAPVGRAIERRAALALLSAAALACCTGRSGTAAETVELVMTEYRFAPDHLSFEHGRPYRLVLENCGAELHEFTAPEFLAAIALDNPGVLASGGKEVVVRPGQRAELRFVALRPGRFAMSCADHDWAGMVGEITVT